jgi:hypothetical protein
MRGILITLLFLSIGCVDSLSDTKVDPGIIKIDTPPQCRTLIAADVKFDHYGDMVAYLRCNTKDSIEEFAIYKQLPGYREDSKWYRIEWTLPKSTCTGQECH